MKIETFGCSRAPFFQWRLKETQPFTELCDVQTSYTPTYTRTHTPCYKVTEQLLGRVKYQTQMKREKSIMTLMWPDVRGLSLL